MADRRELIEMFKSITAAEDAFAQTFLEANEWNLERACGSFFESAHDEVSVAGDGTTPSDIRSSSSRAVADWDNNDFDAGADLSQQQSELHRATVDDYGRAVRAPIAPTTARLFEPQLPWSLVQSETQAGNLSFRNFEHESRLLEAQGLRESEEDDFGAAPFASNQPNASTCVNINSHKDGVDHDDKMQVDVKHHSERPDVLSSARDRNLHSLFRPPAGLRFSGTFDEARALAQEKSHWILVNILEDSDFFSYVLNRDLWSAELVQDIVRGSFVFFQRDRSEPYAQEFARLYRINSFPYLGVIDPRTGEQLAQLELRSRATESNPMDLQSAFLEEITIFQSKHSFEPMTTKTVDSSRDSNPTGNDCEAAGPVAKTIIPPSSYCNFEPLEDEPSASNQDAIQLRLRLFDGKTIQRRFLGSHKISQIRSLVNSLVSETNSRDFKLFVGLPPRSLDSLVHRTLHEENLDRQAVSARWV